ncbi:MAG: ADP-ribosylglycohydrolase family protein [Clostridia bacterium]|nr:ADP-ribosylglycohydrolase family protein [Clostridia bacterium]
MIKFNKAVLRDKIYACWLGKNIGGTIGGPYEYTRDILDLKGFTTPPGSALPNDDLDLQLIWLKALEERGPKNITAQLLGEYWLNFVPPTWNEYGIGKSNLIKGLLPPLSGEYENYWKNSNGAWIRSEIWACCAPGCPDIAIKYALEDAMVDHGMAEGTYAELFTAAIQSAAFVVTDVYDLIKIGFSKIPENCRVAKSVRTAMDCFEKGMDWKDARNMIVKENEDLGWFQAPQNIAFVVIGLLWGKGDFKESMLTAVNCGDDTDCTAATIGALLGIMGGTKAIPEDWRQYIGDNIITVAINRGDCWGMIQTCSELTDRVLAMAPRVLAANLSQVMIYDGDDDISEVTVDALAKDDVAKLICSRSPYSYEIEFVHTRCRVEFDGAPKIEAGGSITFKLTFKSIMPDPRNIDLNWILPEGWSVSSPRTLYLRHWYNFTTDLPTTIEATLTAPENIEALNRIVLEASAPGRPTVGYIPITVLG